MTDYNLSISQMLQRIAEESTRGGFGGGSGSTGQGILRAFEALREQYGSYDNIPISEVQRTMEQFEETIPFLRNGRVHTRNGFVMLDESGRVIPQTAPGFTTPEGGGNRPGSNLPDTPRAEPAGYGRGGLGEGQVYDVVDETRVPATQGGRSPAGFSAPEGGVGGTGRGLGTAISEVLSSPAVRGFGAVAGGLGAFSELAGTSLNVGEDEARENEILRVEQLREVLTPEELTEYLSIEHDLAGFLATAPRTPDGVPVLNGEASELQGRYLQLNDVAQSRATRGSTGSTPTTASEARAATGPGLGAAVTADVPPISATGNLGNDVTVTLPPPGAQVSMSPRGTSVTPADPRLLELLDRPPIQAQINTDRMMPSGPLERETPIREGSQPISAERFERQPLPTEQSERLGTLAGQSLSDYVQQGGSVSRIPYNTRLMEATRDLIAQAEAGRASSGGGGGRSGGAAPAASPAPPNAGGGPSYASTKNTADMTPEEWTQFLQLMRSKNIQGFNLAGYAFLADDNMPSGYRINFNEGRARHTPPGTS